MCVQTGVRGRSFPARFIVFVALCVALAAGPAEAEDGLTLFVMVDGVSYRVLKDLHDQGLLPGFAKPSRVISTFPSTTVSGLTGEFLPLKVPRAQGYDNVFYSYAANKLEGTLLRHEVRPEIESVEDYFDYARRTSAANALIYVAPGLTTQQDLGRLKKLVYKNPGRSTLFANFGGPDGSAHVLGRTRQMRLIRHVAAYLSTLSGRFERDTGRRLNIVLFSDHGFAFNSLKGVSNARIRKALAANGFRFDKKLTDADSVVATSWGNISGASFFTAPDRAEAVARTLAGLPGVDIASYRQDGRIFVVSHDGQRAELIRSGDKRRYGYIPLAGDPLGYRPLLEVLRRSGRLAGNMAAAAEWLKASQDHHYPLAAFRIWDAFTALVENPATVLASTDTCHEIGSPMTRFLSRLRGGLKGTHGGLFQNSSDAAIITSRADWALPATMTYAEMWPRMRKYVNIPDYAEQVRLREKEID